MFNTMKDEGLEVQSLADEIALGLDVDDLVSRNIIKRNNRI